MTISGIPQNLRVSTLTATTITGTLVGAAPAGSLSGTTLAANVVTSSLTTVGTLTTGAINWAGNIATSGSISGGPISGTTGMFTSTMQAAVADRITLSGQANIDTYYLGANYLNTDGTETVTQAARASWRTSMRNVTTLEFGIDYRAASAAASAWTRYLTVTPTGLNNTVIGATTPAAITGTTGTFTGDITASAAIGRLAFTGASYGVVEATAQDLYLGTATAGKNVHIVVPGFDYLFSATGLNGTPIGATTAAAGSFTTLIGGGFTLSSGNISGPAAFSIYGAAGLGSGGGIQIYDGPSADKVSILNDGGVVADFTNAGVTVTGALSTSNTVTMTFGAVDGLQMVNSTDTSGVYFAAFKKSNGTTIGSVTRVTTTDAVAFNTTSDEALKSNWRTITSLQSGNFFDLVDPSIHDWKSGAKDSIGYSAQKVHSSMLTAGLPSWGVTVGDDKNPWMLDYSKIPDPITAAEIKSLRARVRELEDRLVA